jgi:DNA-binding CsgD family transcriptional regulator
MAAIPLSRGRDRREHLEFHFLLPLDPGDEQTLGLLAPTIARTWTRRRNGDMGNRPNIKATNGHSILSGEPLLGPSNPARLSRAEFRVCLLLSRGLSIQGVCEELSLAETTVRSHLRNVYAKTGTDGLTQLLYRLLVNEGGSSGSGSA